MYVPRHYTIDEVAAWAIVRDVGAGHLVVAAAAGLRGVFAPVLADEKTRTLRGHVARGNSWWSAARDGDQLMGFFSVANSYISPSMYVTKAEDPAVVPTWDYVHCEVEGTITLHDDVAWVEGLVRELTIEFEQRRDQPWSIDDAPLAYVQSLVRGVVGFEIAVTSITGAAKLSQNKSTADRESVVRALREGGSGERELARCMTTSL